MTESRTFGASAARLLETGALGSLPARALSRAWARTARVSRSVDLPRGAAVVGVGGPTLGGSGKTPLVLALARALHARGEPVAVVAHGYGSASARRPRRVGDADSVLAVGDDALWLHRELSPLGVPVVVGNDRSQALAFAATLAPRLLVDGLLQTEPRRLALSLLAVDAERPWGAARCPPAGDLRAPRAALVAAADLVVRVLPSSGEGLGGEWVPDAASPPVVDVASSVACAVGPGGHAVSFADLAGKRVGVMLAIARPERVLASLSSVGVVPVEIRLFRDHSTPRPRRLFRVGAPAPEIWLTTAKCSMKMGPFCEGAPVLVLAHRLALPGELLERMLESRVS